MEQPVNEKIVQIIKKHPPLDAIKVLFPLIPQYTHKNLKIIQDTILYLLEGQHDWVNANKYFTMWKRNDWGEQFLKRMKLRVNETENLPYISLSQEINRLAEKYWLLNSPKRETISYDAYLEPEKPKEEPVYHSRLPRISWNPKVETTTNNSIKYNINRLSEKKGRNSMDKAKSPIREMPTLPSEIQRQQTRTPNRRQAKQEKIKIKILNESGEKDENNFSFSAVRAKQIPSQFSKRKQDAQVFIRDDVLDFASEQNEKRQDFYDQSFEEYQAERRKRASIGRQSRNWKKELFSQQEYALIDMSIPPRDRIREKLRKEGCGIRKLFQKQFN